MNIIRFFILGFTRLTGIMYKYFLRFYVRNLDFTIISNNCWAGHIYQDLGLEYRSPTVGLYIMPEDYLKFINNLKFYVQQELSFVEKSRYSSENKKRKERNRNYPIGVLNEEIEVHFLHYKDESEAREKWNRRVARINYSNIFYKMDDQNGCTLDQINEFCNIFNVEEKVFFGSKKLNDFKGYVYLPYYRNKNSVGDIYDEKWAFLAFFNIARWLNSGNSFLKK